MNAIQCECNTVCLYMGLQYEKVQIRVGRHRSCFCLYYFLLFRPIQSTSAQFLLHNLLSLPSLCLPIYVPPFPSTPSPSYSYNSLSFSRLLTPPLSLFSSSPPSVPFLSLVSYSPSPPLTLPFSLFSFSPYPSFPPSILLTHLQIADAFLKGSHGC